MHRLRTLLIVLCLLLVSSIGTASLAMLTGDTAFLRFGAASAKEPEVTMIAVGDVMLSRMVQRSIRNTQDPSYPFAKIGDELHAADFVFGNLETTIGEGDLTPTTTMQFRSDPGVEKRLYDASFRVVSVANNHMHDFRKPGILRTLELLDAAGIAAAGAGADSDHAYAPQYITINGITFAFLAYLDPALAPLYVRPTNTEAGVAVMDVGLMREAVANAKEQADFVIVSMHAGTEYKEKPTATQTTFAHAAVDAGADMVIGAHAHIVQPVEEYKGKYIFYGLGNFVFDQMWSEPTRKGLTVKAVFTPSGLKHVEWNRVYIERDYQPVPVP